MSYANNNIPDHPVIANMERTGYPDGKTPDEPHCPVCGCECEDVYKDKNNEIVGCNNCITTHDAWNETKCFPERD